jgi:chaperonin cofactor prefoldin
VNASSFRAHPEKSPEDSYRQAISDLQRELQNRTEQRDELNRRIALLEAALANLAVVVDDEPV